VKGAQQVIVVGNGRGYLCALVTGEVSASAVQAAIDKVNTELPHYRQVRNFAIGLQGFTPESGLVTANGKLRRDRINLHFRDKIDQMYVQQSAAAGNAR
jgi:long-subunit acyl-CoA synthetase (AMP-forming)